MKPRIALLSNVNMSFVVRLLEKEWEIYRGEGYGNELGLMLDPGSSYRRFDPQITFLILDLMELLEHETGPKESAARIREWFGLLEGALDPGKLYYLSDAYLWGPEAGLLEPAVRQRLEGQWLEALLGLGEAHPNVRIFPYRDLICRMGEGAAFSLKTWYMGKILHSGEAQRRLAQELAYRAQLPGRVPKKVLLLDLDNTLWGGLAGERDVSPIALSQEGEGLAYKNLQRVIRRMQETGVLLAIVSKNNEEDALELIREHPHMVLRPEDFAAWRINWEPKDRNILEIAGELNLGEDSFVFWDDSPAERELVRQRLPQVTVPEFPERPEDLAGAMTEIYRMYFEKDIVTGEDREKTRQYAQNAARNRLQSTAGDYEEYLRRLQIRITRVDPARHLDRLVQLVNKTNQFNLTTRRYQREEMQKIVEENTKRVYLYRVEDCFGDNGVTGALIVDLSGELPLVEEFVLSCRVMGRRIEYALAQDVERDLQAAGYPGAVGRYLPTPRNKPVEELYEKLGYRLLRELPQGGKEYEIRFSDRPPRQYFAQILEES